jgi:hypothetical protein
VCRFFPVFFGRFWGVGAGRNATREKKKTTRRKRRKEKKKKTPETLTRPKNQQQQQTPPLKTTTKIQRHPLRRRGQPPRRPLGGCFTGFRGFGVEHGRARGHQHFPPGALHPGRLWQPGGGGASAAAAGPVRHARADRDGAFWFCCVSSLLFCVVLAFFRRLRERAERNAPPRQKQNTKN